MPAVSMRIRRTREPSWLSTVLVAKLNFAQPHLCWCTMGNAIRVAQAHGLHLATAVAGLSPIEAEIRRRLWASCILLEACVDAFVSSI